MSLLDYCRDLMSLLASLLARDLMSLLASLLQGPHESTRLLQGPHESTS